MSGLGTVTVFSFCVFDPQLEGMAIAPFQAERRQILERFHGEVLEGTGRDVARDELDGQGVFRRMPTGWGELDD